MGTGIGMSIKTWHGHRHGHSKRHSNLIFIISIFWYFIVPGTLCLALNAFVYNIAWHFVFSFIIVSGICAHVYRCA